MKGVVRPLTHPSAIFVCALALRVGVIRALLLLGVYRSPQTYESGIIASNIVKGQGFSLQFTTAQDIDALAAGIRARGGVLDDEPADAWGARVFRLRDPDGFKLVFSSPRAR